MKLDGPYRLTIIGDTRKLGVGYNYDVIGYLMQRLLTGEEAVMENLANLGIAVTRATRPSDFSEEAIQAAMQDAYVKLPITDYASLAAAVNKALETRYGPSDD